MRLLLVAPASVVLIAMSLAPATAAAEESVLPDYTFHMDVAMAMRHFPWLHFHMDGTGEYAPAQTYAVRFDHVPWFFPKKQNDIDLSMLDPVMWLGRYEYVPIGRQGDLTLYQLHALDDASLREATVALGPHGNARWLDVRYNDGTTIHMHVRCSMVDGFLVPATLSADIDEPHLALSADASFDDYDFGVQPVRPPAAG